MNRCATCKHWSFEFIMPPRGYAICEKIRALPRLAYPETAELPAFTEFDNDGSLYTPPDFGCTLHEEKE